MKARGSVIEAARKLRGWKRSQVATMVGLSYQGFYNIECEFKDAAEETLQRIANALGLTLTEVAEVPDEPKNEPPARRVPTTSPQPSRPVPPPRRTKDPAKTQAGAA